MKGKYSYWPLHFISSVLLLLLFAAFCRAEKPDTLLFHQEIKDKQLLLNGRIWRNQYAKVSGDQFFLTPTFMKGSVVFNGRRFNDLDLLYDIADDELILKGESFPTIILNKEMVDSFSLNAGNRNYYLINEGNDSSSMLKGYVNVLYEGSSGLYVKYIKKIQPLAVDGRLDLFYQEDRAFLKKDGEEFQVSGKKKLLRLLSDKKKAIRNFIRTNRIKLRSDDPETFIPLVKYYDSLNRQTGRR
jgi:hypothetical protein